MKKNIAFISIKSKFCNALCKMFCNKLEMLYADFNDILQYNLVNADMLDSAGQEYFDSEEQKVLKSVVECENIGINIDFSILNKGENISLVKDTCLVIYLRYSKQLIEKFNKHTTKQHTKLLVAYDIEDKICANYSDIVVDLTDNLNKNCENLINAIKKYYKLVR